MNQDYASYNGVSPSWADMTCKLSGTDIVLFEMKDLAAINTSRTVEVGEKIGASGGRVMSRTTGASKQEMSLTMYLAGYHDMLERLAKQAEAKGFVRGNEVLLSLVHFDIQFLFSAPGDDRIYDRRLKGIRVIGDSMNATEGTETQKVEVPCSVIKIADMLPNGKEAVLL